MGAGIKDGMNDEGIQSVVGGDDGCMDERGMNDKGLKSVVG